MENSISFSGVHLVQFIAVLLTGLVAGLFYGYDCSVTKGLGNLSDLAYLQSFQSINKVIQNPYFFFSFMGSVLVLPLASWLSYDNNNLMSFYLLISSTLIYFIGVLGVTIFGNVPLNEQFANFSVSTSSETELSIMRNTFEKPWNYFHRIRTIAAIISFGLAVLSIILFE
uniref:DUF1772 domain-containing protein n=1 Tax=Ignavibacterium album TaxID=591197 RepID=A0A7V3E7T0_9BACT